MSRVAQRWERDPKTADGGTEALNTGPSCLAGGAAAALTKSTLWNRAPPLRRMRAYMEAGSRYLEGTTVGGGRDIIGVRRDRIAVIIEQGREIITRAKHEKILPETITGATAALLVTISGYGEPLSEGQWRELSGVVGGIMADTGYADLARLRALISQEQFVNVARNQGYSRFIRRLDDGRWVCELAPKLEDVPDE